MSFIRGLVLRLILVVLLALGMMLMLAAVVAPGEDWSSVFTYFLKSRTVLFCAGLGLFALGTLLVLTGTRVRRRERFLSLETESGRTSISTDAICNYIGKLAPEFPSIVRMTPKVIPHRGRIDVLVHIRIKAGPQIHEVCEVLQKRVRDSLASGLGISEIRRIEVSVKEISTEHKAE